MGDKRLYFDDSEKKQYYVDENGDRVYVGPEHPKKTDSAVKVAVIGGVVAIIVAIISIIPLFPRETSSGATEYVPGVCIAFSSQFINSVFNCGSQTNNIEIAVAATLTAVASTPMLTEIAATNTPLIPTQINATDIPVNTPTLTDLPTDIPMVTRTPNPVVYFRTGSGRLDTYSVTIDTDEIIVGNANILSLSGNVNKNIDDRCIVYSLRGPGTWTINVTNGSIKHFRGITDTLAETYYQAEEDEIVQNSGGACGTTQIPIYHFQVEGSTITRDSDF